MHGQKFGKLNEPQCKNVEQLREHTNINEDSNFNFFKSNNECELKEAHNKDSEFFELQNVIRELHDENGRLVKLIKEKEEEVRIIRKRWLEESEEVKSIDGNAASKIVFFFKKCRTLTAELECERLKFKSLQNKLSSYEEKTTFGIELEKIMEEKIKDYATLKQKLNDAMLSCSEQRNEIENLKKELKIAHKVLHREIGEYDSFQALLNTGSTWRGRQQQIVALQSKIDELEDKKIENKQKNTFIIHSEERHLLHMKKLELEKKELHKSQEKQLQVVTQERDNYKEKNSAARVRNQVLSLELKNLKDQLKSCKEKNQHDDELISVLLREQESLKDENNRLKLKIKSRQGSGRVFKVQGDAFSGFESSNSIVKKLKSEMVLQEQKVEFLENEISHLNVECCSLTKSEMLSPPSTYTKKLVTSGVRKQYSVSSSHEIFYEQQLCEAKCLCEIANVEKEKLHQLVDILHRRNEELVHEVIQKDTIISEGKNNNVKLEKQIEKLQLRSTNLGSKIFKQKPKTFNDLSQELLALSTKLAIQVDNNEALKISLENVLKAKSDDLRVFQEAIEQTKSIFLQGLREYRKGSNIT